MCPTVRRRYFGTASLVVCRGILCCVPIWENPRTMHYVPGTPVHKVTFWNLSTSGDCAVAEKSSKALNEQINTPRLHPSNSEIQGKFSCKHFKYTHSYELCLHLAWASHTVCALIFVGCIFRGFVF